MNTIAELNDDDFDQAIAGAGALVVVDLYVPWCGPCKMLAPILQQLAINYSGSIRFSRVNVDESLELAGRFEIAGVSTLLFFSNGEFFDTIVGFAPLRALFERLRDLMAKFAEVRVGSRCLIAF